MDKEGWHMSVKHPLSLEGFHHGLTDCPDTELVQFVLDGIHDGVRLGSLDGVVECGSMVVQEWMSSQGPRGGAAGSDAG